MRATGDVALATFEDQLSSAWPASLGDANPLRYFRILTAFWLVAQQAANQVKADLIMVDVAAAYNDFASLASKLVEKMGLNRPI